MVFLLGLGSAEAGSAPQVVTRNAFTEINDVLFNPGIGLSDFHHKSEFPYPAAARPSGKTAYYRFYWRSLDTVNGVIDTRAIDAAIATAASRGQMLGLRIMSANKNNGDVYLPAWVKQAADAAGGAGSMITNGGDSYFWPNYDNAVIIDAAADFLAELGRRYGDNPHIAFIDVGMVGVWGEWHDGGDSTRMPSLANAKQYIDMHRAAFPNKPLVMLAGNGSAASNARLQYGVDTYGLGWRGDCWGNAKFFDSSYNGRVLVYPTVLQAVPGLNQSWQQSPVVMESCGSINSLFGAVYTHPVTGVPIANDLINMQKMVDFAVDEHVSSINTYWGDAAIPPALRPMFEQMLRAIGYRFALREVQHPDFVINGSGLQLKSVWENVGNAPPYAGFRLSYRLRRDDGAIVKQWINTTNLKTWLPGGLKTDVLNDWVHDDAWNPVETPVGTYKLDLALLWPHANEPAIALATAGRRSDGWYEVSELQLVNRRKVMKTPTVPAGQSLAGNITDNDMASSWHNGGLLANGWVELELEKEAVINTIAYKDDWPRSLGIAVATVPGVWTTVANCTAGGSATDHTHCAFPAVPARYIRIFLDYGSTPVNPNNIWMVPTDIQVLERP